MGSKLFEQLNGYQPNIGSMMQQIQNSPNPNAALMNMAEQNPAIAKIMKEVQQNGGDARGLFFKKAQQMGINPNNVISKLR